MFQRVVNCISTTPLGAVYKLKHLPNTEGCGKTNNVCWYITHTCHIISLTYVGICEHLSERNILLPT